jgi:hypothetical protein
VFVTVRTRLEGSPGARFSIEIAPVSGVAVTATVPALITFSGTEVWAVKYAPANPTLPAIAMTQAHTTARLIVTPLSGSAEGEPKTVGAAPGSDPRPAFAA